MVGATPFEVWANIRVDRPELRDDTYPKVAPGTRSHWVTRYATQGQAVRFAASLLRGEWDFSSEYVCDVMVVKAQHNASPRTVRRRVERQRVETTRERQRALVQVAAARRGNLLVFHADYMCQAAARATGAVPDAYDCWLDAHPCAA